MRVAIPWLKTLVTKDESNSQSELIPRVTAFWLLIINLAVLTPLYQELAPWTLAICAICFVWRVGIFMGKVARPPRLLVSVLAMASAATLLLITGQLGTLSALINLLILGYSLKFIEMRSRRDVNTIILVGYFLIALAFIKQQSMLNTLHLLLITIINTAGLVSLYQGKTRTMDPFIGAATITGISLPLAALLFVALPRFPPLWIVPDNGTAQTGLSENLRPGDISELARNADLAFRVTFDDYMPTNTELYWRAMVLDTYDGVQWRQNAQARALTNQSPNLYDSRLRPKGQGFSYEVITEPSGKHWLFSLDLGHSNSPGVVNVADARLFSIRQLDQKFGYRVNSYPDAIISPALSPSSTLRNLKLPEELNPRTQALATQLLTDHPLPRERVNAIMDFFASNPFFYTLRPPSVGKHQIDDFLFDNQAGFCIHYASAMVVLARASGIPARMVSGYQGGELNQSADYMSVYQYMAHAWVEVWLADRGWVLMDPTVMVAPERVLDGFDAVFSPEESYLLDNPLSSLRLKNWPWLNDLRLQLASLDYYWSVWVLGFNDNRQKQIFTDLLGKASTERIGLFMLTGISLILLIIAWYTGLLRLPKRQDQLTRKYKKLLYAMKRLGVDLHPGDGPRTVGEKIAAFNPQWQQAIFQLTAEMEQLLFAPPTDNVKFKLLRKSCIARIDRLTLLATLQRSTPTLMNELGPKSAK